MTGWGGLVAMIVIQAIRDCEGKDRGRLLAPEIQLEAEAWLLDGQCEEIREVLGGLWLEYTAKELVARAKSGEINWASVARAYREYWMST